jgi:hypothetical protein
MNNVNETGQPQATINGSNKTIVPQAAVGQADQGNSVFKKPDGVSNIFANPQPGSNHIIYT